MVTEGLLLPGMSWAMAIPTLTSMAAPFRNRTIFIPAPPVLAVPAPFEYCFQSPSGSPAQIHAQESFRRDRCRKSKEETALPHTACRPPPSRSQSDTSRPTSTQTLQPLCDGHLPSPPP